MMSKLLRWLALLAFTALLQGCATVANPDPRDPLESMNRTVFGFNDAVDRAVLKPVATAYKHTLPSWTRTGICAVRLLGTAWAVSWSIPLSAWVV